MGGMAPNLRLAASLLLLSALASCGGGGSNRDIDAPLPPPAQLSFLTTTLADGVIGVPYNQTLRVNGGTGARTFSIGGGRLPDGLVLNGETGVIAGVPAGPTGAADFTVEVLDSSSPPLDATRQLSITINAMSLGRNDTIADATPLGNGTFSASISPSGDPSGLLDPDEDYYSITTTANSTITVDINAAVSGSPLDSAIELVDSNGIQLTTCVAPDFADICVNDDEDFANGILDSYLQLRVAGNTTFYIHVLDWGSNARPDLVYDLVISGVE